MIGSNNDMKLFYFYSRYHFDSLSLRGILLKFNLHLFHDRSNDMNGEMSRVSVDPMKGHNRSVVSNLVILVLAFEPVLE